MTGWLKTSLRVSLLFLLVWCVFGISYSSSYAYQISRQVLDGGGAAWFSSSNYKLCSSVGQSITGIQEGATKTVYTGFWNRWAIWGVSAVDEEDDFSHLPKEFDLRQNYPNPFNPTTIIEYALPKASEVKIRIYNILGQKVRSLVDEHQDAGYKRIQWDGKDDGGNEISSGVYFYRIEAGDFVKCKKMTLLK